MKLFNKLIIFILFTIPLDTFAHGYWIEVKGSNKVNESVTVRLYFGEYSASEKLSGEYLNRMNDINVFVMLPDGIKQSVTMKQLPDYWEGTFNATKEGSYEVFAVSEEREVQDWTRHELGITRPIQYLKTGYQVGNKSAAPALPLFINVQISKAANNNYKIVVTKKDAPLDSAKITIMHPDDLDVVYTGRDGSATFTLPKKALYIVDVVWIDKTPGRFKEKPYATVHYKFDYSLYHK